MTTINSTNAVRAPVDFSTEMSNKLQPATANASLPNEASSKVTLSPEAMRRGTFADVLAGGNAMRAMMLREDNISSASTAKLAEELAYSDNRDGEGGGGLIDISGNLPGGDGIVRYSMTGEPVTDESKAYFNKEEARYKLERAKLYEAEIAKKTPPGEIVNKLYGLQDQQPARFRGMNGWPIDADFA